MPKAKIENPHADASENTVPYFNILCELDEAKKESQRLISSDASPIDKNQAAREVFELKLKEIELGGLLDGKSLDEVSVDCWQARYDFAKDSLIALAELDAIHSKLQNAKEKCRVKAPKRRNRAFGPAKAACISFIREYPEGGMVDKISYGNRATPSFYHWAERQKNLDGDIEVENGFSVVESNYGEYVLFENPFTTPPKQCLRKHAGLKTTLSSVRKYLIDQDSYQLSLN